ncbi:EAL domain-containing protein [Rheinheimera sp.]|uniref:bifunctional diguanylate cyclase/phosphodiesterase n=1 Tax=Rheinheimera sp. TaxID=1869214 RepID=UPI0027B893D3|nr:EAL domain-containing protein [Rheinheimera sp.]
MDEWSAAQPADVCQLQQQNKELLQQRHELLQQNLQLQRETSILHLINKLALQLNELMTPAEIYPFVAQQVAAALGFEDCAIFVADVATQSLQRVAAVGSRDLPHHQGLGMLAYGQGIVGQCAVQQTSILVPDTRQCQYYLQDVSERLSELAVPVLEQGELLAVIDCEQWDAHFFNEQHQQILEHVASILSSRLRKLQDLAALEQSIQKLEYAELVQKALFNIASLSYDAEDFTAFYQHIHQNVSSLIYAPNFYIALFDDQDEVLHFPYFVDTTEHISPTTIYPKEILANSLTGYVFRTDRPLLADRAMLEEFDRTKEVTAYGSAPESWLGVPFRSGDAVRGVVVVQSYDPGISYDQKDLELLTFVSQHISSALERAFVQQRLRHQALHDALTNLPNRILFIDRVNHAFKRRLRYPDKVVAVLYLDLDRFKMVNDTLGHQVGDEFLIAVGHALKSCLRQNDTLARLGGDEFAILLEDVQSFADVVEVAERIAAQLQQPFVLKQHQLQTSTSIGIAFADVSTEQLDTDELIRRADIAMYQAKQDGRGIWRQFCAEMDFATTAHYQLETELKAALQTNQFDLYYQPIVDLAQEHTLGFEALIRWQHPERGLVLPNEFIPLAEELGLLQQIDLYVVQAAVKQLATWRLDFANPFYVSVNVSGRSFSDADFSHKVLELLAQAGVQPFYLAIEITESALIDKMAQAKMSIDCLRAAGVKVLLDDFGTGYSSLSYLHEFQLDVLKIDRSFIAGIRPRIQENAVVNTIITLAKTLSLTVIAEGIETSLQRKLLSELGCDAGQGYWFAKAVTAKEASAWLR